MTDKSGDIILEDAINLKKDFPSHNYNEWKSLAEKGLKGGSFEEILVHKTIEEIEIKPLYTQDDIKDKYISGSEPGIKPFIRGGNSKKELMDDGWHICQRGYELSPRKLNGELKKEIKGGCDSLRIDISPEISGVHLSDIDDINNIFEGIDIKKYPILFNSGDKYFELFILLIGFLKNRSEKEKDLNIFLNADPIGVLAENGKITGNIEDSFKKIALLIKFLSQRRSKIKILNISSLPYHNAGCDSSEEIAFALATIVEYAEALSVHGIDFKEIISSALFSFGLGTDFFMEISKFRAFRMLLSKISDRYDSGESSGDFSIMGEVSGFCFTKKDPYINILRATTSALSGIAGGIDFLTISPFDSAFNSPGDFSKRVARNIQLILKEESGMKDYIDPSAGSYFIESLTKELMEKGWELFLKIEKAGGMLKALKSGFIREIVDKKMGNRKKDLRDKSRIMVGINKFENKNEIEIEKHSPPETGKDEYIREDKRVKNSEIDILLKEMGGKFHSGDESSIDLGASAVSEGVSLNLLSRFLNGNDQIETIDNNFAFKRISEEFENGGVK